MTLREFRLERELGQRELARLLGVSQSTVSRMEASGDGVDKLRVSHLRRLARRFGSMVVSLALGAR